MTSTVTPRSVRSQVQPSKRWSAPPGSKNIARAVRSPEEIIRDVRGLKLRQRVSLVLSDDVLRGELEDMVSTHRKKPVSSDSFRTYQDFLIPMGSIQRGYGLPTSSASVIADIRGADTMLYSKEERQSRCTLASVYRLMQLFGWGGGMYDRAACTVCALGDDAEKNYYFIAPTGLLFNEVSASSVVKVDQDGQIIDGGKSNLGISKLTVDLHATIHAARRDAKCVMFLCPASVVAVAVTKHGLLPLSPEAVAVGEVSYHDFPGVNLDEEAKNSLLNSFGSSSRVLILRNCGAICVGETLEETVFFAYMLATACSQQITALNAGVDDLSKIEDDVRDQMFSSLFGGLDANENQQKMAELYFEAWMRLLDAKGCKTGYNYKNPEIFKSEAKEAKGHEVSPAKTSSARQELFYRGGDVRRSASLGRGNTYRNRVKWLNSPVKATEYKRERELDNSEPVLIKDSRPEKEDKDQDLFITTKVVQVSSEPSLQSTPYQEFDGDQRNKSEVEEVVTYVEAKDRKSEPRTIELLLDDSQDDLDARNQHSPVIVVREPVGVVRRKSGSKVKKRRSFRERMSKRLSSGQ